MHLHANIPDKPTNLFSFRPTGDVSPISMSPISQSQFIPLGDILCLAISAMNSARKTVTQETLIEHLATFFPGSTIHYIKFNDISVICVIA